MSHYNADVVIVGAGPAGTTAAYFLAQAGVEVALVDQAKFPRPKSCGDGLGYKAIQMLQRMGLGEWVQQYNEVHQFLLSSPDHSHAVAPCPPDVQGYSYTVPRFELDARLVETAADAGAELHAETRIHAFKRSSETYVCLYGTHKTQRVTYEAPLVLVADGGKVSLTRRLGLAPESAEWVAVRAYYEGDVGDPHQIEIHWERSVLPGYGWLFAMGEGRVNVGIGAYSRDVKEQRLNLQAMLETFVTENPHAQARLENAERVTPIVGHPLRANAPDVTPFTDNVLIVGEAAGVVSPLSGEGIAQSMVCGQLAAQHAQQALEQGSFSADVLAAYGQAFHAEFDRDHKAARRARAMLNKNWLINRSISRASHDEVYAAQLNRVLVGKVSAAKLFSPRMSLGMLLG